MAVTQDELYATLDLELSWSEQTLPEHVRTKHVHRLHPYHGKFIPQLVEVLIDRYFARGAHVLDPFAGSGTTLVQALESGLDATGVELAAFNCLLIGVKTAKYDVGAVGTELRDVCARLGALSTKRRATTAYLREWYAPEAVAQLLAFRDLVENYEHRDVMRVILSRAARSARRAAHFDLEAPREAQTGEYWCHKHKRICRPVESAVGFLRRYTLDALARIEAFAAIRDETCAATHPGSRLAHGRIRDGLRRCDHLAALPRPDRLSRATSLRVRVVGSRRCAGARARCRGGGHVPRRDRGVLRRSRMRTRERCGSGCSGRADRDRRERPSRRSIRRFSSGPDFVSTNVCAAT